MAAAPDESTDAGGSALEAVERHVRAFFRGHDVAPRRLGLGPRADHATFRVLDVIGEPWLPGASTDHLLVSVPYPFGPELGQLGTQHRHVLWLVPITAGERAFEIANGLDGFCHRCVRRGT